MIPLLISKQRLNNKISPLGRFLLFDPMISLFHKPILVFGTKNQEAAAHPASPFQGRKLANSRLFHYFILPVMLAYTNFLLILGVVRLL